VLVVDARRAAGKKSSFRLVRRQRWLLLLFEASALPPAHHMARILAPLLPERQAANNCTSTLANFSFYIIPAFVIISPNIFPPSPPRSLCIIAWFFFQEGYVFTVIF
jgi:hypothetical protein